MIIPVNIVGKIISEMDNRSLQQYRLYTKYFKYYFV